MEGLGKEKGEGIGQKVGGNKEVGLQGSGRERNEAKEKESRYRGNIYLWRDSIVTNGGH